MSISDMNKGGKGKMFKTAVVFLAASLFCIVFSLVYARYSHSVHSGCMTFMFAYPLLGGTIVYLLIGAIPGAQIPQRFVVNIYNSGIATLTVGSILRGIFEIAGTSSPYQPVFMVAGMLMVLLGMVCYFSAQFKKE